MRPKKKRKMKHFGWTVVLQQQFYDGDMVMYGPERRFAGQGLVSLLNRIIKGRGK